MTIKCFNNAFNALGEAIGHGVRITKEQPPEKEGDAFVLVCDQDVAMVIGSPADVRMIDIICTLRPDAIANGLTAFCTAIDVLGLGDVKWRNSLLDRLHLFDGKLGSATQSTQARGWEFKVCPQNPGKKLLSYMIKRIR